MINLNDPELKSRVLDWQRRHQVRDDDPAMALVELFELYFRSAEAGRGGDGTAGADPAVSTEVKEEVGKVLSALERLSFQNQELKEILAKIQLAEFSEQMRQYQENMDFATKKMALVIKEADDLLARLGKVGSQINPIARGAVIALMAVSGIAGWLIAVIWR